jgi:hypothetical protein
VPPSNSRNSNTLTEGRKEAIDTTARTLQWGNISSIPLSKQHYWSSRPKKKKTKNINYQAQEVKTITKNNSRCVNLNTE